MSDAQELPHQIPLSFGSQAEALDYCDSLDTIALDDLHGLWQGRGVPTGHPFDGVLENLGWYGKRFRADHKADALLFRAGDHRLAAVDPRMIPLRLAFRLSGFGRTSVARAAFPYVRKWLRAKGPVASLRSLSFRGKISAAMGYDRQPIIDHFRQIDANHLFGIMVVEGDGRYYFFVLERTPS